jgi:hypothetical protein
MQRSSRPLPNARYHRESAYGVGCLMRAVGYGAGDVLELPDGRRCIVLSFDFANDLVRITWTRPEHKHEDVAPQHLVDAVLVPKALLRAEERR